MSDERGRFVASVDPPVDSAQSVPAPRAPLERSELSTEESTRLTQAIADFRDAVDAEIEARLDQDEVQLRLREARRRIDRWSAGTIRNEPIDELAKHGYRLVRLWILLACAAGVSGVELTETDIDDIAQETVAQAINRVCGEPAVHDDWQVAFSVQCVDRLPIACRSWQLKARILDSEELDQLRSEGMGQALVRTLREVVADKQAADRLWELGYEDNLEETLELTRTALGLSAADRLEG
jgi:hypothetical protein